MVQHIHNLQKWDLLSPNYTHTLSSASQIYFQILAGADAEFICVVDGGFTPVREDISESESEVVQVHP